MTTNIKLKRSAVNGNIPTTAQLELGEVAINTFDGNLFIKKNDGAESIVTIKEVTEDNLAVDSSALTNTSSDFLSSVLTDLDDAVVLNNAKVTNATHSGDVTGATALTIAANAVNNAKLANMATQTIKGRSLGTTGDPQDLSATQVRTILGIEAGADVTDTVNVTAAGAVMDSELTDIAAVKALNQGLATTDSPTFAGVGINGDLTVTGDVTADILYGDVVMAGNDSGAVALTVNDGQGNANLTFNHAYGIPDVLGNGARIVVNVDSTSGPKMTFQLGSAVTVDTAYNTSEIMNITNGGLDITGNLDMSGDLSLPDGAMLILGDASGLSAFHNGVASYIDSETGALFIRNRAVDGTTKIVSDDGAGGLADYFRANGANGQASMSYYGSERFTTTSAGAAVTGSLDVSGDISLPDTQQLRLGTGNDMKAFHNGSNGYIDNGTGATFIRNFAVDGVVKIQSDDNTGTGIVDYFRANGANGEASMFHYGVEKITTTSTGAAVTGDLAVSGTVTATNFAGDGSALAGVVATADTSTAGMDFVIDEDTMASNLATKVPTQQSVKAYVDNVVASGVSFKGSYDAATNTPNLDTSPTGVAIGDMYAVTVAGTFYATDLNAGDTLIADAANPATAGGWTIIQPAADAAAIKSTYESNANTNAFTDTEQTKLSNIETAADVTDAINVTAAGALMDSEVVNLAQVKAFDSADYATAAQGTLAGSALQNADIGSSVQAHSTVLVNTTASFLTEEKSKLSGIETAATADQTAAQIKTAYESNANTNVFSDAEQTKLSGIETGANVTDTANVTSSGALMDSEVINLAAVKAFDGANYATAAQGSTADAALPLTGGTITGNLAITGTVDGVDLASFYSTEAILRTETYNTIDNTTAGRMLIGIAGGTSAAGDVLGELLFYNRDASTGGSGRRIGGSVELQAADAFGRADLVFGVNTSDPIALFDDPSDFTNNTIEVMRLIGDDQSLEVSGPAVFTGLATFGNITVTGTVDGRDVATDGTKLDGIETAADVTDTINVTAAGAVMDSELTNIAAVKALNQGVATTDSPTFAGATVTGDLGVSGNIVIDSILTVGEVRGGDNPSPLNGVATGEKATLILSGQNSTAFGDGVLSSALAFTGTNTSRRRAMIAAFQDGTDGDPHGLEFFTYNSVNTSNDGVNSCGKIRSSGELEWASDISASSIIAGQGSGAVALTVNDGQGNANLTFNHANGIPDILGNGGRIVVNTDLTSLPTMTFELGSAVTAGVSYSTATKMQLDEAGLEAFGDIKASGKLATEGNIQLLKVGQSVIFTANAGDDIDIRANNNDGDETPTDVRLWSRGLASTVTIKAHDTDVGVFSEGLFDLTGDLNVSGDISLPDGAELRLGTGDDMTAFHNGSNGYINNATGALFLRNLGTDGVVKIQSDDNTGTGVVDYFRANGANGEASMSHYGVEKITTTSTGANFTGNITVTGTVDGRDVAADGTKLDGIEPAATADQTAGEIEAIVTHDNLLGFVANEHIDWTTNQGATNINAANYTNTTYTGGAGITLNGSAFDADALTLQTIRLEKSILTEDVRTTPQPIRWDVEDAKDSIYTHSNSTNPERVTVSETGYYQILCNVFFVQSGASRITGTLAARKNGVLDEKTIGTAYSRGSAYGDISIKVNTIMLLSAGDYIDIYGGFDNADTADALTSVVSKSELILSRVSTEAVSNTFRPIDDVPVNGATTTSISSNWAFDHAAGALMDSELTDIAAVKALNQGVATTDSPTFAGATVTGDLGVSGNISLPDNGVLNLGTGNDLTAFHNGNNAYISTATGALFLRNLGTDGAIKIQSANAGNTGLVDYITLNGATGEATLNYYGSKRINTNSTGADITGDLSITLDLAVAGDSTFATLPIVTADVTASVAGAGPVAYSYYGTAGNYDYNDFGFDTRFIGHSSSSQNPVNDPFDNRGAVGWQGFAGSSNRGAQFIIKSQSAGTDGIELAARAYDGGWTEWTDVLTPLSMPTILAKRYIQLSDYVSSTSDSHTGMQAFLTASEGREGVINSPIGSSVTYGFAARTDGSLILPLKARLIQETGALLDFSPWNTIDGAGIRVMQRVGALGGNMGIVGNLDKGDTIIPVSSTDYTALMEDGMWLHIGTDENFTEEDYDSGGVSQGHKGEWVKVAKTVGANIHLVSPIKDSYIDTGNNLLIRRNNGFMADLVFDGIRIRGPGQFDGATDGDRGIHVGNAEKLVMRDCDVTGFDHQGILAAGVIEGLIDNTTVTMLDRDNNTQTSYGIAVANTTYKFDVVNSSAHGGREAMCLTVTGDSFGAEGTSRGVNFINNLATGARRSGFATHDNHDEVLFHGNRVDSCEQGFDCRIQNATFSNNIIKNTGTYSGGLDCGFQLGSGVGNVRFFNNYMENVLRGHWMPANLGTDQDPPNEDFTRHETAPGDITIDGDVIRTAKNGYGTLLNFMGSSKTGYAAGDALLGTLNITNVDYELGSGAGNAVRADGRWTDVVIQGKFTGGSNFNVVHLRAPVDSVSAGNGPSNPSLDIKYGSGYIKPLITQSTGITDLKLRGIGFRAEGQTWQATVYMNPISLTPQQSEKIAVTVSGVTLGDSIQIQPATPDDYMVYYAHATGTDAVEVTATNVGSATQNPAGGTYYLTLTKRGS